MMVPWVAICVALLSVFQFGFAVTIVNTMMDALTEDLGFDESVGGGVAASVLFLGAGIGSLVAGPFERLLSEYGQLCIGLLFTTGDILCALSTNRKLCWGGSLDGCVPAMILAGRLIAGFASGLALVNSPRFLAIVSPVQIRGSIGACSQVSIALGAFVGLLIGLPFEVDSFDVGYEWWRVMFFMATAPAMLQCFLAIFAMSSFRAAKADLSNNLEPVDSKEVQELEMAELGEQSQNEASKEEHPPKDGDREDVHESPVLTKSLSRCFERQYRRCVLLGIGVPMVCQLSFINVVASYSTTIFEEAGLDLAVFGSILFGLGSTVASSITAFFCDRFNRKTLATVTFSGMTISFVALALSDLADSRFSGPLSVVFVETYVLFFGAGCGFLGVGYAPEVVPPEVADVVLGTGQSMSIFLSLLLVLVFPSVLDALGMMWTFAIFALASFSALLFLRGYMIETKGRSLKRIIETVTSFGRD